MFQCVWMKYRGPNIYEFMFGKTSSRNASIKLCDDVQFEEQTWITQARMYFTHLQLGIDCIPFCLFFFKYIFFNKF